jgi:hypothetical protein
MEHSCAKVVTQNVQRQNSSKCARNVQQQATGDSAYSSLTSAAFGSRSGGLPPTFDCLLCAFGRLLSVFGREHFDAELGFPRRIADCFAVADHRFS